MSEALYEAGAPLLAAGWSLLPIAPMDRTGDKKPAAWLLPYQRDEQGKPRRGWEPYLTTPATLADLRRWADDPRNVGLGAIGGDISGGAECLDFEYVDAFEEWELAVHDLAPDLLDRVCIIDTPRPGVHVWLRSPTPQGSLKLAHDRTCTPARLLVESRGTGGYALIPGTPGHCHKTGREYRYRRGSLVGLPLLTADERNLLFALASELELEPPLPAPTPLPGGGIRPGDDFDVRGEWAWVLEPKWWRCVRGTWDCGLLCRPGKNGLAVSASTQRARGSRGEPLLKVFTTSTELEPGTYGRFNAYTKLYHGGKHAQAAKALAELGYGTPTPKPPPPPAPARPTKAEARATAEPDVAALVAEELAQGYVPFPVDRLPFVLARFVRETADAIDVDPAFVALPALSVLAGCVGSTRRVAPSLGPWREPLCIWTAVIASSGECKSPPFRAALRPAAKIDQRLRAENAAARERYEEELAETKGKRQPGSDRTPPKEPRERHLVIRDTTLDAATQKLADNPRGVIVANEELRAWFASFCRYVEKGDDSTRWLGMHDGDEIKVTRKHSPTLHAPVGLASVCGTIQPGIWGRALRPELQESGLEARFVIAMPPRRRRYLNDRMPDPAPALAYADVVQALWSLQPQGDGSPEDIHLDEEARTVFLDWHNRLEDVRYVCLSERLSAIYAKIKGLAARLAGLFHLVDGVNGGDWHPCEIGADAVRNATALADWFLAELQRVHRELAPKVEGSIAAATCESARLIQWLQRRGGECAPRDLVSSNAERYPSVAEATMALDQLVVAKLVLSVKPTGARKVIRYRLLDQPSNPATQQATEPARKTINSSDLGGKPDACWVAGLLGSPPADTASDEVEI